MAKEKTEVMEATPLADTSKGEVSPAADQSDRGSEIAARMVVAPVVTAPVKQAQKVVSDEKIINEDGEEEFIDPDELEEVATIEDFPQAICVNCRNHGRGEVDLNDKGFCKKCGFKLNKVHNIALEPAKK